MENTLDLVEGAISRAKKKKEKKKKRAKSYMSIVLLALIPDSVSVCILSRKAQIHLPSAQHIVKWSMRLKKLGFM